MKALAAVALLALVLPGCAEPPPPTGGLPEAAPPAIAWTSPGSASIRPGVQVDSGVAGCTSNFVFTGNGSVYLGFAAHCVDAEGAVTDQDGCNAAQHRVLPLGSEVDVQGASKPGRLAYSSWGAMQAAGEADPDTCRYNDFAAVAIDPADWGRVNPAMLRFGGPTGLAQVADVQTGDKVLGYGNSQLRQGVEETSPKEGYVVRNEAGGWSTVAYSATPGISGDSGSGVILADGLALGVMVTLEGTPLPLANRISTLAMELDYARRHGFDVQLATWDLLDPGLLPA